MSKSAPQDLLPRNHRPTRARTLVVLMVWFVVSAICALVLLAITPRIGLSRDVVSLVMAAPAVGAAATLILPHAWVGSGPRCAAGPMIAATVVAFGAGVLCVTGAAIVTGRAVLVPGSIAGVPFAGVLVLQLFGALCEEIGFRGVLLHGLRVWMPRLVAACVTGLLFGLWHIQYFALPVGPHVAFVLSCVLMTIILAEVMVGSFWQRMLPATVLHATMNVGLTLLGADPELRVFYGMATGLAVAATIIVPLSYRSRQSNSSG